MTKDVTEIRAIRDVSTLHINGTAFESHEVIRELGRGANGVVYLAENKLLKRREAVKVWQCTRASDTRDKTEQGLAEARKLASASKEHVVEIFSLQIVEGAPVAVMEFVDGQTLREFRDRDPRNPILAQLAAKYLEAIEATTTRAIVHGDPHLSNVLVYEQVRGAFDEREVRLKLCDFGTSLFAGKVSSSIRHWKIVEETVLKLTAQLEEAEVALSMLASYHANLSGIDLTGAHTLLSDLSMAQIRNSPLRDYLRHFKGVFW